MFAWVPGVRLDVGVLGAEERLGAVAGEVLDLVDDLAAAVVPLAGHALGVLVVEPGAERLEHRHRREVLRGDELEGLLLALQLRVEEGGDLGIGGAQRGLVGESGAAPGRSDGYRQVCWSLRSLPLRAGCGKPPRSESNTAARNRAFAKHARGGRRAVDDSRGKSGRSDRRRRRRRSRRRALRRPRPPCPRPARRGGWRWSSRAGRCAGAARARSGDPGTRTLSVVPVARDRPAPAARARR